MKKNKIYKLLMLPIMALIMLFTAQNVYAQTVNLTSQDSGWFWTRTDKGVNHSWHLTFFSFNGKVAYCIEPNVPEGDSYSTGDWSNSKLSNDLKERMLLIAHYGYDYPGHQSQSYRAATQGLLWETQGTSQVAFSSERWGSGTNYDVSSEKNEILRLVNNHYVKPSFNGTTITANVGETFTLTDTNNVLSNYEVYASNGAEVSINGNQLLIRTTNVGNVNLRFAKKQYTNEQYIVYYGSGIQTMLSSGAVDPVYSDINIKSLGGKVAISKIDSETKSAQGEATLKGAIYGVYDKETDELIEKITTDTNGNATSSNLPKFGNFYIKEINPSEGYQLDNTKYEFTSTLENKDSSFEVKENVIKRNYEFTKVYSDSKTTIMTPEPNVDFGFYNNKGELVKKVTTDKDGRINVSLVYGTYTVRQLTSTTNFEKVKDFTVQVSEMGETIYKVISNAEITAKLKVIKVDKDTGKIIERANIKFKIFDVKNNKYVEQSITYPKKQTISIFETDENGILITPYPLNSGEYLLEEVDQVIDGYIWNKQSEKFEIGENSELINDKEFGILFEVKFENKAVKGSVSIVKNGESVKLTDNGYEYTSIKLSGVKFGLYANEDIYDGTGTLVYKKNTLVKEAITDKNGSIKIDDLYLGKYYIKELETVLGHVLDKEKYEFELNYKDQYTEIIYNNLSLNNHLPKGDLEFTKSDFSESKTLPNTLIEIYTDKDELIFSGRTDENGIISIKDIPVGKYYILEKEAPEGYELNPEKMWFEIKEDGEIVKCTMKDNQIVEVPNTEAQNSNIELCVGLFLILGGAGVTIYEICKSKKNKKK